MKELYCKTVELEANTLINLSNQKIVPRAMNYLKTISSTTQESKILTKYVNKYQKILENSMEGL